MSAAGRRSPSLRALEGHLRQTLGHLHDPGYLERNPLSLSVALSGKAAGEAAGAALRRWLLEAIEELRAPAAGGPRPAGRERLYELARLRYLEERRCRRYATGCRSGTPSTTGGTAGCSSPWRPP